MGIAVSRFNEAVTGKLLSGAVDALTEAGVAEDDIEVVHVPGAFELPLAADALARTKRFDLLITLGAVIRGETDHYDYICRGATDGVLRVGLDHGIPCMFGVLTVRKVEHAVDRAGGAYGNKGAEVALDGLKTLAALRSIGGGGA